MNRRNFITGIIASAGAIAGISEVKGMEPTGPTFIKWQTWPLNGDTPKDDFISGTSTYKRFLEVHLPTMKKLGYEIYFNSETVT